MTRPASSALLAHLNTQKTTIAHDLWTFALLNGLTLRYTSGDRSTMTLDGRLFSNKGPTFERDTITWKRGIETNTLTVTLGGDATTTIAGTPLVQFATADGFSSAAVMLERAYYNAQTLAFVDALPLFSGVVGNVDVDRYKVEIELRDDLSKLDVMMPRGLYQGGCLNTLYDTLCAVSPAAFSVNLSVSAIDPTMPASSLQATYGAKPSGWFTLGRLLFTSGRNAGISRTVKDMTVAGGVTSFLFGRPFPFPIAVADAFTARAGCDRTQTTCDTKFDNLPRLRATPYVPDATTVT